MENKKFAILITTKNRLEDLIFTLGKIDGLLQRQDVECIICDDGSTDGTFKYLQDNTKNIVYFRNEKSKGLIYSRNRLLEKVTAEYAISIDDDLHFITEQPLEIIEDYFIQNPKCALVTFRIFWSKSEPLSTNTKQLAEKVKSYAGGAHAMRVSDWRKIPDYPEWFVFYGEENFAACHMHMHNMEIHYLPKILVHHRVDTTQRKKGVDNIVRRRRSLRSGWYFYFLFMPRKVIPQKLIRSVWDQFKCGIYKRDIVVFRVIFLAFFDLMLATPEIFRDKQRLSFSEYEAFMELGDAKYYWKPEENDDEK